MSESQADGAKEQAGAMDPFDNGSKGVPGNGNSPRITLRLVHPSTGQPLEHPSVAQGGPSRDAPPWLRPFFSLRVQLLFTYSLVLVLAVILVSLFAYKQASSSTIALIAFGVTILGILLALVFTTLLLRPLWRVTDAAQAIAIGDLEQRERLPLRLPPQDEIDRLAGSLNEMVTRLERADELQRASEQRFQRFFSDASHQLRTPLTSIRGFTEVLMRGAKDDPETAQRVLKRMKGESERMTYLINDILTLSRLNSNHAELKLQYVNLVELASEGTEQAKTRVRDDRTITFKMNTQGPVGLQGDKEQLKQLLFVLFDNALKHGRAGSEGLITLQLDKGDRQAVLRMIDNGEGISKEDMGHIFDSFYRGHQPPVSGNGGATVGTGLGLTIAAAIVRAHHGTISAQSEPGKGTEFTITLPCIN
jgi:signal transduction histidine kinase